MSADSAVLAFDAGLVHQVFLEGQAAVAVGSITNSQSLPRLRVQFDDVIGGPCIELVAEVGDGFDGDGTIAAPALLAGLDVERPDPIGPLGGKDEIAMDSHGRL